VAPELIPQAGLRVAARRKDHEARGVAIDPMDDERPAPPPRPQVGDEQVVDRRGVAAARERHRQQTRGLVDHDEAIVLVDDPEAARRPRPRACAPAGAARAVHPDAHDVSRLEPPAGRVGSNLGVADEDLAAPQRGGGPSARSEAIGIGQVFVEAYA
jgi:hypothetical protein